MARTRKDCKDELPNDEQPTDVLGFLKFLEELRAKIPPEAWAEIPSDLSENFEHYMYGHPQQKP